MKSILVSLVILFSVLANAQVDLSEQEKIQQQREKNRQEDALRESTSQPNAKPSDFKTVPVHIDSDAQLDVDHSAIGFSVIPINDNMLSGFKFSGGFTAGFYQEQKLDKKYALLAGVELPIDIELPLRNFVPFGGGGLQVGVDGGLYLDLGLDFRFVKWFKLQAGLHYVIGRDPTGVFGAALTW